ncbi:MAG: NlpC/P60 family protein [Hyphomicrobium sp.]|jgi:NlpC/P60 family putative phage cell wall peptidase
MPIESTPRLHGADEPVRLARDWIGTPYHHQASLKGVGTDCLGLIRGIWRELYSDDAELPPAYSRDWGEANGEETLLAAARRHLREIPIAGAEAGDVVIFRIRPGSIAKHAGLIATGNAVSSATMIHAMEGSLTAEVNLTSWWRRRIAAAFAFPGTRR